MCKFFCVNRPAVVFVQTPVQSINVGLRHILQAELNEEALELLHIQRAVGFGIMVAKKFLVQARGSERLVRLHSAIKLTLRTFALGTAFADDFLAIASSFWFRRSSITLGPMLAEVKGWIPWPMLFSFFVTSCDLPTSDINETICAKSFMMTSSAYSKSPLLSLSNFRNRPPTSAADAYCKPSASSICLNSSKDKWPSSLVSWCRKNF